MFMIIRMLHIRLPPPFGCNHADLNLRTAIQKAWAVMAHVEIQQIYKAAHVLQHDPHSVQMAWCRSLFHRSTAFTSQLQVSH